MRMANVASFGLSTGFLVKPIFPATFARKHVAVRGNIWSSRLTEPVHMTCARLHWQDRSEGI